MILRVQLLGYRNPVTAAVHAIMAMEIRVNIPSFDRVASIVGDSDDQTLADGFVVKGYDDLQRLCEIGGFVIAMMNGELCAFTPAEWQGRSKGNADGT